LYMQKQSKGMKFVPRRLVRGRFLYPKARKGTQRHA